MEKLYDVIIIGSGPAGLAAGIYASRAELENIVIEKNAMSGGQIINTYEVDNYPGFQGINGFDLAEKFREHCDSMGTAFVTGEVAEFAMDGKVKIVTLDNGERYEGQTVIIATGAVNRKLGVDGEERLSGMGVSYCATCDGAFFRNRVAAVIGGGNVAVEDAIYLARMCKKVYLVHRRSEFRATKSLMTKLKSLSNIELVLDSKVERITGEEVVEGLTVSNINTGEQRNIELDGVFVAIGTEPISKPYRDIIEVDDAGYIKAGEDCKTNVDGIYAAGDIRTKELRQILTAAADGANAITAVEHYLAHNQSFH